MAGPNDPFAEFNDAPGDAFAEFGDAPKPRERTFEEKVADPETRRKIAIEGGREFARATLNSAKKEKNPLARFAKGVQQSLGAQFVGAGSAAFGVGDANIRKKFKRENPWMTDEDATEAMKAYRDQVFSDKPLSATTGAVAGGVGTGGVLAKGAGFTVNAAGRIIPQAAPALQRLQAVTQLQRAQPVTNAAKLAGTGLTAGTVTTGIAEGRAPTPEEAAIMAAAGPLMQVGGNVVQSVLKPITSRVFPAQTAASELARRVDPSIDERLVEKAAATGDQPLIGEALRPSEQRSLADFVSKAPESQNVMDAGADAAEQRFRQGVRDDVGTLGPAQGANVTERARDEAMRVVMDDLRPEIVTLTPQILDQFLDNGALRGITRAELRALQSGQATVDVLENIRSRMSNPSNKNATAVQLIEEVISNQYPEYGRALREYARQSSRAAGATAGASGVLSDMTPDNFAASQPAGMRDPRAAVQAQRGFAEGALDKLVGAATESADKVARQMQFGGLRDRLNRIVNQGDVAAAGRSIEQRGGSLASVRGVTGRNAVSQPQQDARTFGDAVTGAIGAFLPLGGAAKAGLAQRASLGIAMPNSVRVRVAEMMLDPEQADEAIAMMQAAGMSQQQILDIYQGMAAYAGIQTGLPDENP